MHNRGEGRLARAQFLRRVAKLGYIIGDQFHRPAVGCLPSKEHYRTVLDNQTGLPQCLHRLPTICLFLKFIQREGDIPGCLFEQIYLLCIKEMGFNGINI
jgi:hypothetical protein